jgi:hypothetical protein
VGLTAVPRRLVAGRALRRGAIVAVLCAAACSSDGTPARPEAGGSSAPPQSAAPPASTIPADLAGTFATLIASADVPRADEAGFWALTLTNDGTYTFGRAPDVHPNTGSLTTTGDTVTFSDEEGEGACPGPGKYTWSRAGDVLSFTVVDDSCLVRKIQTTSQPYVHCSAGAESCVKPS